MKDIRQSKTCGRRLGVLRKQQGLSLRACARRAGVAPSFLSKVERGQAIPTVTTLENMVEALGTDLGSFFRNNGEAESVPIVFPRSGMSVAEDSDKIWRYAFPKHPQIRLTLTYEEYLPGTRSPERSCHTSDMYGMVLAGELTLTALADKAVHRIKAGDAFIIPAGMEHVSQNKGKRTLKMIVTQVRF